MTDVLVQYGHPEESEDAEQIADKIKELSDLSVETQETENISWGSYYGVISVGNPDVNQVYSDFITRKDWGLPNEPVIITGPGQNYITDYSTYENTIVQGIAGYNHSETGFSVDYYTNETDSWSYFIGSSIDDFIDAVKEKKTGTEPEEPTEDPYTPPNNDEDGVADQPVQDPDYSGPDNIDYQNQVKFELQESGFLGLQQADVEFTVSDSLATRDDLEPDSDTGQEDPELYDVTTAEFLLAGGSDDEIFDFNGKIISIQAEKDLLVTINGKSLLWKADQEGFVMPSGPLGFNIGRGDEIVNLIDSFLITESLQQKIDGTGGDEEGFWESIIDTVKNPTKDLQNIGQALLIVIVLVAFIQALNTSSDVLGV